MRLKNTEYFVGDMDIAADDARGGLIDDPLHDRPQLVQPLLDALYAPARGRRHGAHALA